MNDSLPVGLKYYTCHVCGAEGESGHPRYGGIYVWDGRYAPGRSPEEIGSRERNTIKVLRPYLGVQEFWCDGGIITEVDPQTFGEIHPEGPARLLSEIIAPGEPDLPESYQSLAEIGPQSVVDGEELELGWDG